MTEYYSNRKAEKDAPVPVLGLAEEKRKFEAYALGSNEHLHEHRNTEEHKPGYYPVNAHERFPTQIPIIVSHTTVYAGPEGDSILGWTIPGDRIVLHKFVIDKIAYFSKMDPSDLMDETLHHEWMHNVNPHASEAQNRAAVAHSRARSGYSVSPLHSDYLH